MKPFLLGAVLALLASCAAPVATPTSPSAGVEPADGTTIVIPCVGPDSVPAQKPCVRIKPEG